MVAAAMTEGEGDALESPARRSMRRKPLLISRGPFLALGQREERGRCNGTEKDVPFYFSVLLKHM